MEKLSGNQDTQVKDGQWMISAMTKVGKMAIKCIFQEILQCNSATQNGSIGQKQTNAISQMHTQIRAFVLQYNTSTITILFIDAVFTDTLHLQLLEILDLTNKGDGGGGHNHSMNMNVVAA